MGTRIRRVHTGEEAKAAMYEKVQISCAKSEYTTQIRDRLLDYELHCQDVGDDTRKVFTREEIKRLDKKFNVTVQ